MDDARTLTNADKEFVISALAVVGALLCRDSDGRSVMDRRDIFEFAIRNAVAKAEAAL